jgi:hypothetical protein
MRTFYVKKFVIRDADSPLQRFAIRSRART